MVHVHTQEQEIRKRHHQIEKKQLFVDRLNREYDEKRLHDQRGGQWFSCFCQGGSVGF